ncbi:hypothetical protein HBI62_244640 [Parastagonospora nodorum]|nr:hypothetical protein HBI62_244640 [Parastagonospora nodorum]KAH6134270.1 hypothetical protein HBI63_244270 [Parastagonospora nodorum]KAH6158443.1 hypothetical protein HBI61_244280 [Parastagonospora nodorum]
MRPISTNNDSLRHEQQQRPPIPRRILNCYIFAIMTPLICDAMTLTSDEYETLYTEVKREIRERAILYYPLQSTAPNSRLRTITHLAMRSKRRKMRYNHNPETRLRNNDRYAKAVVYSARYAHEQDQILIRTDQLLYMRDDLATEYKDISSLNYTQFIRTLEREVEFEDKRSSIYYYTKTADTRWHSALQDTVATKLYRATFVIELLI